MAGIPFELKVLYANVVLYALCYMAQAPVLPYISKKLGADMHGYGTLQTAFSAAQFVGGLLSGPLVDRYGGRALLLTSFAASAVCYALTATASSMSGLYLSRIPTVLQHAVLAARTLVAARSSDADRARLLGYVGVAYGVGFAAGPALGGLLSRSSLQLGSWLAAAGSLVSVALVAALLRDGASGGKQAEGAEAAAPGRRASKVSLSAFLQVCRQPGVAGLLLAKASAGLAFALFHSAFPLVLDSRFGLDSRGNGLLMSYVGLLAIAVQAFLLAPTTKRLGEHRAAQLCCGLMLVGFAGLVPCQHVWQLCLVLLPLSAGGILFSTINTAQLSKAVPSGQQGTVLAVDMSLGSGLRMVAPALATAGLQRYGYASIGACAAALAAATLLAFRLGLCAEERAGKAERKEE